MYQLPENNLQIANQIRSLDGSIKYLLRTNDDNYIETVFIPQSIDDIKFCISNQVGCSNKCSYCATGFKQYIRDMGYLEIVAQVSLIYKEHALLNFKPNRLGILFMGMGEPFFNYQNVMKAVNIFISLESFKIPTDMIIISTSGIVPRILDFSSEICRPRLAVSINACDNALRDRLMPINKIYPLEQLLNTCKRFIEMTGDKIIFEYVLIKNINDSEIHMQKLIKMLKPFDCEIHLIPFNENEHIKFFRPENETIERFYLGCKNEGLEATLKPSYGVDILGGCGQLKGL